MKFGDLYRPAALLGLAGATAALGLVAGVAILRDPALARRLLSTGARGLARAQLAAAETVEDAIDLWEELRAQARREVEDSRFAAAAGPGATGESGDDTAPPARSPSDGTVPAAHPSGDVAGPAPAKAVKPRSGAKKQPAKRRPPATSPEPAAKKPRAPRSPGAPRTPRA